MIENYGDVTALSILVGLLVWYFKHQTKRQATREDKQDIERAKREEKRDNEQKEERDYYRNLVSGDLRKNADLNAKGITLQKKMMVDFKKHNGHSEKFSNKTLEVLNLMCDKMNGGNKKMVKAKETLTSNK